MKPNIIDINKQNLAPAVGMAASYHIGCDSYPYTIVSVSASGKSFVMQADRVQGSGIYTLNTDGKTMKIYRNVRGEWAVSKQRSGYITVGYRLHRMDPHF